MRRLSLVALMATIALPTAGLAQNYVVSVGSQCCSTATVAAGYTFSGSAPNEGTLAAWAAKKAVEAQQASWWGDSVKHLTREEVDARSARLDELEKWAKTLSNHIFADAYCDWVRQRRYDLAGRRQTLDQVDVGLSIVRGLPQPPGN